MNQAYQLTQDGINELKAERDGLLEQRAEAAEAIKVAREQGDLAENAEYHAAKDEQARLESRIQEIEHILNNATLITNDNKRKNEVGLGSTVELASSDNNVTTYTIVGSVEADPAEGKISDESPIGKALLGKKVGEEVVIERPAGPTTYQVKKIS